MPFCPECKYEYIDGVAECPDCRVALVSSLEQQPEQGSHAEPDGGSRTDERPFCCWDAREYLEASAACSILKSENIACWIERSERPLYSAYTREENYHSSYYVMTPESQAYEARRILEHVMPTLEVSITDDIGEPVEDVDEDIINGGDVDEYLR